jgi:hypothetical protein
MKLKTLFFTIAMVAFSAIQPLAAMAEMPTPVVPFGGPSGPTTPYQGPTESCIHKTGGGIWYSIVNDKYSCMVEGKKLMLVYMGLKFAAPEGYYVRIPSNQNLYAGKGGHILYNTR